MTADHRHCGNCAHFEQWEEVESWEMSHIRWWEMHCTIRPGNDNLKNFPFINTKCKTWQLKEVNK